MNRPRLNRDMTRILVACLFLLFHAGCTMYSSTNNKASQLESPAGLAQFKLERDRGAQEQKVLTILALSGGGSRAAYFSALSMLQLEKVFSDEGLNLLKEVDAISSVSGGSLPAAYYAISQDAAPGSAPAPSGRSWDEQTVKELMGKNYIRKWMGNWFWPGNIAKYWFTAYDRSDIMAQTFADNLYDTATLGADLTYGDINRERPYLIINATNGTEGIMGETFTFTKDDFLIYLNSDISSYDISRAVMASASFPSVFNYMTLRNFRTEEKKYMHVFDGGNTDNLGLKSVMRVIGENTDYDKIIVILVDAFVPPAGVSSGRPDPREFMDYAVDLNFLDSFDSLLSENRRNMISMLESQLQSLNSPSTIFYHVQFSDIADETLRRKLHTIDTHFKLKKDDPAAMEEAVARLLVKENSCLQEIRSILKSGQTSKRASPYCTWTEKQELAGGAGKQ